MATAYHSMNAGIRWSQFASPSDPKFLIIDVENHRLRLCRDKSRTKVKAGVNDLSSPSPKTSPPATATSASTSTASKSTYEVLCTRDKLPNYSAFDWSKTDQHIVAIGAASGEANIISINPDQRSPPSSTLAIPNLSGSTGSLNGSSSLTHPQAQNGILTSFPIKHQRKCNSIAFSASNYLATGLERVRNDYCMNVYDLSAERSKDELPLKQVATGEGISSLKFFSRDPDLLLAGVIGKCLRLYDMRDPKSGFVQFSTRQVHNIAIDPLDENYFVSAGPQGDVVAVWDRRFPPRAGSGSTSGLTTPQQGGYLPSQETSSMGTVLEVRAAGSDASQNTTIWGLRFSGTKRGCFGALVNTGGLKIFDLAQHASKGAGGPGTVSNQFGGSSWASSTHYVRRSHTLRSPWYEDDWREQESQRVIAYDFIKFAGTEDGRAAIVALHPNKEIEFIDVPDLSMRVALTAMDELAIIGGRGRRSFLSPKYKLGVAEASMRKQRRAEQQRQTRLLDDAVNEQLNESTVSLMNLDLDADHPAAKRSKKRVLAVLREQRIHRRRCLEGYMLNARANQVLVADKSDLRDMWETIARFESLSNQGGMRYNGLDLSYCGVHSLWNMTLGSQHRNHLRSSNGSAVPSSTVVTDQSYTDTIVGITQGKGYPSYRGYRTSRPAQRQLCLALCGWSFSEDRMEMRCAKLLEDGQYYKAIVTAVMQGFKGVALKFLRIAVQRRLMTNIGLGAIIACDIANDEQRELCQWMLDEASDPYLGALLSFFINGDWRLVVDMAELSLSDRVGTALKYFDDARLSNFLAQHLHRAITVGDPEGILLTGLTDTALDIFQQYIAETSDLQTAVLAMSYTCPLYVPASRFEAWHQTYLLQMQVWRAFQQRESYAEAHRNYGVVPDKKPERKFEKKTAFSIEAQRIVEQPAMACKYCQRSLGYTRLVAGPEGTDSIVSISAPIKKFSRSPAAHSGLLCPQCGEIMPACGICGILVGQPDPRKMSAGGTAKLIEDERQLYGGGGEGDGMKMTMYCFSCQHCYHAGEAREWFARHKVCPVPQCRCLCGLLQHSS